MERGSDQHSARLDDEMQHEVESLTRGAPVEARADEDRLMEDAGDGEPPVQALVDEVADVEGGDEVAGGLSHGEVRARSELAIHLRPGIFPATRAAVLDCAREGHAPVELLGQLEALPDRRYENVGQVWEALGGKREHRAGEHEEMVGEPAPEPAPAAAHPTAARFEFRFDPVYRVAAMAFGVHPENAYVEVAPDDDRFTARFGPWVVETELANVVATTATGPYGVLKTIGPAHVSLSDRGLTFATNHDRGLCIRFRSEVQGLAPTSLVRHPALTVTVDDVDGLARVLEGAGRS
jgi:hypothetical protein